jgi:hypothetical protein
VTATRFDGPRAFVVTFERVDPLWTIDLSKPAEPRALGHLEIPGFVDHLEPRVRARSQRGRHIVAGDRLLAVTGGLRGGPQSILVLPATYRFRNVPATSFSPFAARAMALGRGPSAAVRQCEARGSRAFGIGGLPGFGVCATSAHEESDDAAAPREAAALVEANACHGDRAPGAIPGRPCGAPQPPQRQVMPPSPPRHWQNTKPPRPASVRPKHIEFAPVQAWPCGLSGH